MNEQRKVCVKCGQEFSVEDFYKSKTSKDGYSSYCKTCTNESSKLSHRKMRAEAKGLRGGVYKDNPELAHISTRALLAELSARGYHGKLIFQQEITI